MWKLERSILTKARPLQVWTTLADFEGFKHWHPLIRLSGPGVEGAKLDYTVLTKFTRKLAAPATLIRYRKPKEIGWLADAGGILLIEEIYVITGAPTGTEIRHQVCCKGLLARMPFVNAKGRLEKYLEQTDWALERKLSPTSTPIRDLSRHDRRAAKRRTR